MENSKKSAVQPVKVFKLINVESNKINNDLSVKIVDNCLQPVINPFQIPTRKFDSRIR